MRSRLAVVVVAASLCLAGCATTRTTSARSVTVSSQLAVSAPAASTPASSAPASSAAASSAAASSVALVSAAASDSPDAAVEKQLWALANSAATGDGSTVKLAQAVRSTHSLAVAMTMGDGVEGDQPVWVIQVEGVGEFVCDGCSYPQGAVAPRGRFQLLVVDASTFRSLDGSIGDRKADLTQLGPVTDLHP